MKAELMSLILKYNIKENPVNFTSKSTYTQVFITLTEDGVIDLISNIWTEKPGCLFKVKDYVLYNEYKRYRFVVFYDLLTRTLSPIL